MLDQLLTAKDCAACKWCCKFNAADLPEIPQIYPETLEYIKGHNIETEIIKDGEISYFHMSAAYNQTEQEEEYTCPMLRDGEGCALGEARMFDCKIWPFRVMDCPGGVAVTMSVECAVMNKKTKEELLEELLERGLAELIFRTARQRPAMIKPFGPNYRIILYQKDFTYE